MKYLKFDFPDGYENVDRLSWYLIATTENSLPIKIRFGSNGMFDLFYQQIINSIYWST